MHRIVAAWALAACAASAESVQGRVVDSTTGEALARVRVQAGGVETVTGLQGEFQINGIAAGTQAVYAATVGYRPFTGEIAAGQAQYYEIALHPETLRHTDSITVSGGPFAQEAPMAVALAGNELKNLASVLADDPLRAVQALPGVVSNDDFQSQFALRGASYERVGIYMDGVLLHSPFHGIEGEAATASLTIFNGDMLESLNLYAGAPPPQFADRTAGALDLRSREGDRRRFSVRGTASASNAGVLAEGPLFGGRGSWLAAARKSYLQYLIERTSDDPTLGFGFTDGQGRLTYELNRSNHISVGLAEGRSGLDRSSVAPRVGLNSIITSAYHYTLANIAWRLTPGATFLATNRVIYMRERFENTNREGSPLGAGGYGEWVWRGDATHVWGESATLAFGGSARRVRDDGFTNRYLSVAAIRRLEQYRGSAVRSGAWAHQSWSWWNGRAQFSAGGRWDRHSVSGSDVWSPYASAAWHPWSATRVQLAWGQYVQFPEIEFLFSLAGRTTLLPMRATHAVASLEQRLDERTRVCLEFYDRQDRDLLFRPLFDPRVLNGRVFTPPLYPPVENSQRGYARGFDVMLQRRTANGITGWVAYAYGRARVSDGVLGLEYPADYDLRHSFTGFASYRIRPTVNLSGRFVYGSGLPARGFFEEREGVTYLSADRNQLRLPHYQRTDLRLNKIFVHHSWHVSLYAEVVNVFNRRNLRYSSLDGYNAATGALRLGIDRMLPILPSAGVVVEF
jgi:hypothetical protein